MPVHPPSADVACQLCEAFLGEVRALERTLNAAKSAARVSAHKRNANLIYQDTKRPMPEPVTSLLVLKKAKVTELRPEDSAVLVDPPAPFDAQVPVVIDSTPATIIHAAEDTLYLNDMSKIQVGQQVTQTQPLGALEDVFAAFHEQWKQRWCKHDDVPHSHWERLVAFARAHMPSQRLAPVTITPELLRAEVAAKKARLQLALTELAGATSSRATTTPSKACATCTTEQAPTGRGQSKRSLAAWPRWPREKVRPAPKTIGLLLIFPWYIEPSVLSMPDPCLTKQASGAMQTYTEIANITKPASSGGSWSPASSKLMTRINA